jgi:hypothetical protein
MFWFSEGEKKKQRTMTGLLIRFPHGSGRPRSKPRRVETLWNLDFRAGRFGSLCHNRLVEFSMPFGSQGE